MNKIFASVTAAAVIASGIVALPAFMASQVEAAAPAPASTTPVTTPKSDRLDVRTFGADCSQRAWPYYEAACLRDAASPSRATRTVRNVSTDKF